jgi:hypothetical protein
MMMMMMMMMYLYFRLHISRIDVNWRNVKVKGNIKHNFGNILLAHKPNSHYSAIHVSFSLSVSLSGYGDHVLQKWVRYLQGQSTAWPYGRAIYTAEKHNAVYKQLHGAE